MTTDRAKLASSIRAACRNCAHGTANGWIDPELVKDEEETWEGDEEEIMTTEVLGFADTVKNSYIKGDIHVTDSTIPSQIEDRPTGRVRSWPAFELSKIEEWPQDVYDRLNALFWWPDSPRSPLELLAGQADG